VGWGQPDSATLENPVAGVFCWSMSEHRLIIERLYEAFNDRRFDVYAELLDEDVLVVINGGSLRGVAALREVLAATARERPGVRVELEQILAESGDTIVTRTHYLDASAAAKAPEPTASGAWPLPITLCEVYRIAGGRIVEWRDYFAELTEQPSRGAMASWPGAAQLVAEQAALRRVATLVARGGAQAEVFETIVSEVASLFGQETWLCRCDADDMGTVVAADGPSGVGELPARVYSLRDDSGIWARVRRTSRPARADSYAGLTGPGPDDGRWLGVTAWAAAPLFVQATPWGLLQVVSRGRPLAAGIEDRLAQFAELAATAVAGAETHAELRRLVEEQAALRRVAELIARGAVTQEVFDQVTAEAGHLLNDAPTILFRYEQSGTEVVVVARSLPTELGRQETYYTVGASLPVPAGSGRARVRRAGRAVRIDSYAQVADTGVVAVGFAGSVSAPITVEGRLWGP
jgi:GAF domain-containing protein/limonene-1,2-epoxide hydrolase